MNDMDNEPLKTLLEDTKKNRPNGVYDRQLTEEQECSLVMIHAKICALLAQSALDSFSIFLLSLKKEELELLREKLPNLLKVNQ